MKLLGRQEGLVGESDQASGAHSGELLRLAVGDHVATADVLGVDPDRRHVDDRLALIGKVLTVGFGLALQLASPQRAHHGDQQLTRPERLDQISVDALSERALGQRRIVFTRHQDDRRGLRIVADDLPGQAWPELPADSRLQTASPKEPSRSS